MTHQASIIIRSAATVALLFAFPFVAHAATLYVANNGVDEISCGPQASPCRSISRGIVNAAPGDTIVVGPGKYSGDLDNNGLVGELGEETGSPGCGCMLSVNKSVILLSSHGAASTVIDARLVDVPTNVLLILNGGEFGRPGKGFTVTNTKREVGTGIAIDSLNVKVRGNQVTVVDCFSISCDGIGNERTGVFALLGGPILIEGNQVVGWRTGIRADGTGKTVRKNQVSLNTTGINATSNAFIVGNVVTHNSGAGIFLNDTARAVGNAMYGNGSGIAVDSSFSGVIERNNLVGNFCGVSNLTTPDVVAAHNYWGAASGPGPDPADDVCGAGTTTVTPFATAPFAVRAPIRP